MKLLFVDACPRDPAVSRTYRLCEAFCAAFADSHPGWVIQRVRLADLDLPPFDGQRVLAREALVDADAFDAPEFALARDLAACDLLLIGAPYWDLSFPAMLKLWVEHIFVRRLTFVYTPEGDPVGLCKARSVMYLTTAGSPVGENDFGETYLRGVTGLLGMGPLSSVRAEGLDIQTNDAEALLAQAMQKARELARSL